MAGRTFKIVRQQLRLLLLLLSPAVFALMALLGLHLFISTTLFREVAQSQLNDVFAGKFEIRNVRLDPDPRLLHVYGVRLEDTHQNEVFTVEELKAEIDWLALAQGTLRVSRADLYGADVKLDFATNDVFNLTDALYTGPARVEPEQVPPSIEILIENVRIHRAQVTLKFATFLVHFEDVILDWFEMHVLGDVVMRVDTLLSRDGFVEFRPEMFGYSSVPLPPTEPGGEPTPAKEPLHIDIKGLEASGWTWSGPGFRLDKLVFVADGGTFEAHDGSMDFGLPDGFGYGAQLEMQLPARFKSIAYFAGPIIQSPLSLRTGVEGVLTSELNDNSWIDQKASLRADGLDVLGLTFDQAWLDVRLVNRRVYLTDLVLQGYGGEIALAPRARGGLPDWVEADTEPDAADTHAYLNLLDLHYNLPLTVERLELQRLVADLAPTLEPGLLTAMTGVFSGNVRASGRLVEREDTERFITLPAFHRLELSDTGLKRPAWVARTRDGLLPVQSVSLEGRLMVEGDTLRLETPLNLGLDRDSLRVSELEIDLGDPALPMRARVAANIADAGRYAGLYGVPQVHGGVSMRFAAEGPLLDPIVRGGELTLTQPGYGGLALERVAVAFGLHDGTVELGQVTVAGMAGTAEAHGSIHLFDGGLDHLSPNPTLNLVVPKASVALAPLLATLGIDVPIKGDVQIERAELSGPLSNLSATARLRTGELEAFGEVFDEVQVEASWDKGKLEVRNLAVRMGPDGRLDVRLSLDKDKQASLRLSLRNLWLHQFAFARALALDGHIRHVELKLDGEVDLADLDRRSKAAVRGGTVLNAAGFVGWLTTQPLDIRGSLAVWHVALQGRELGHLMSVWDTLTYLDGVVAGGQVPIDGGGFAGDVERRLALEGVLLPEVLPAATRMLEPNWRDVLDERTREDVTTIRDYINPLHPALLDFSATVPMVESKPTIVGAVHFHQLDVRSIVQTFIEPLLAVQRLGQFAALDIEQSALRLVRAPRRRAKRKPLALEEALEVWRSLSLSGDVELFFDRTTYEYGAFASFDELKVKVFGRTLTNDQPIQIGYDGNKLNVDLSIGANDRFVRLIGDVTEQTVGVRLQGFLDLRLMNFLPSVLTDVTGVAEVDLTMRGTWDRARPRGFVRFLGDKNNLLSFRLRAIGKQIIVKSGRIVLDREGVSISDDDPLLVEAFDGRARIEGALALGEGYTPTDGFLTVSARNMTYRVPGTMNVTFHADLRLDLPVVARPETWRVSDARSPERPGVQIVEGHFTRNISFLEGLLTAYSSGRTTRFQESAFDQLGRFKDIALDVSLIGRDSFYVNNEIETVKVDLELRSRLFLQQTVGDPQLAGSTIEVLPGGKVEYQGEAFEIQQGVISWADELANPNIDIAIAVDIQNSCGQTSRQVGQLQDLSSTGTIQTYHIVVKLEGTLDNLRKPELTSSPYADERDILTLIATHCTTDQLSDSLGGVSGAAVGLALRPWVGKLEDWLTQVIPVDELSIDSDGREARVGLQKRLSKQLVFNCALRQGENTEQRCGVQIIFQDNLFLEFSERNEGNEVKLDGKLKLRIPLD